jgi:hypothetical protein
MTSPTGGMRTSLTNELTILPKAAPMTMPTAMSITLPRTANSLNSLSMARSPFREQASLLGTTPGDPAMAPAPRP